MNLNDCKKETDPENEKLQKIEFQNQQTALEGTRRRISLNRSSKRCLQRKKVNVADQHLDVGILPPRVIPCTRKVNAEGTPLPSLLGERQSWAESSTAREG